MSLFVLPLSASALLLALGLGVRHGLDPDHVAAIDGLTFGTLRVSPRLAPWSGPLFALGHGFVVSAAMLCVVLLGRQLMLTGPLAVAIDWLPVVLLVVMGAVNVRALLQTGPYQPGGWKSRLLPLLAQGRSLVWAAPLIGMLFAFDGVPQGIVLGGIVARSGVAGAAVASLLMTGAMMGIAALDSRTLVKLGSGDERKLALYRRISGWAVVAIAFAMASYEALALIFPQLAIADSAGVAVGAALILAIWAVRAFGLPLLLQRRDGLMHRSC